MSRVDERLAALKSAIESELTSLRLDNAELNSFVGDIEALIPEDCRNTRPDRLASVRAAVGLMAQKVASIPAPSAKDGPTELTRDERSELRDTALGYRGAGAGGDALNALDDVCTYVAKLRSTAWQAAREGMVPLEQYENAFSHWEAIRIELTTTQDELRVCKSVRDTAERRVGELELALNTEKAAVSDRDKLLAQQQAGLDTQLRMVRDINSDRTHLSAELERVKAELAGWKEWSKPHGFDTIQAEVARLRNNERELGELFGELGLGLNANDTMDSVFATIRGWRDAATAPASDEVTEAELSRWNAEHWPLAGAWENISDTERTERRAAFLAARRNHGGSATELGVAKTRIIELEAVAKSFDEAMDALAQIENLCGSDQELEPDEVVELARKTLSKSQAFTLPLTEAQREELAKVAQDTFQNAPGVASAGWPFVIDAIAPRIARMGVELLSVPRERLLQLAITNNRSPDYTGGHARAAFNWEQFAADVLNEARAILAAAQGGPVVERDMKPENSRKSVSHFDRATHYLNGLSDGDSILVKRDRLIAEFADVEQRAIPQPPRGRKLTDGEREKLLQFARCWADAESAGASREDSDNFVTFVESLLAPQSEAAHSELSEELYAKVSAAQPTDRDKANSFYRLGFANGRASMRANTTTPVAQYDSLAPQDEVRVALGV